MKIGNREFETKNHTYVMGILNVTPDSFSDGGKWSQQDIALKQVEQMLYEGMDVLDVGGESTKPGYIQISEEEEIGRVVPIIEKIKSEFNIPISLDTYKSNVAQAGIEAGVDFINDIWGLKYDKDMAKVIAKANIPCCLMHNRKQKQYQNFMQDVVADLADSVHLASLAGIADDKIILDPGVGFAKTYEQNLQVIRGIEELKELDYPLLLGCSRKSVIGQALDLPIDQRVEGTIATSVMAAMYGCMFVRVHDVKENVRAIRMAEAILGRR